MTFTLATWNINSVRLREGLVAKLMAAESPDVLCLQECKSPVEKIPVEQFQALGYRYMVARGQKGYNGVAILSKLPIKEVGAEDFADLGHARHVAAQLQSGVTIHNVYVPAGGDIPDQREHEQSRRRQPRAFRAAEGRAAHEPADSNSRSISPGANRRWLSASKMRVVVRSPEISSTSRRSAPWPPGWMRPD